MPICLLHAVCRHINNEHIIMGLLEFNKLPINTLVGADWRTFKAITGGREIDAAYTGKYRLTKAVCRLLSTLAPLQDKRYEKLLQISRWNTIRSLSLVTGVAELLLYTMFFRAIHILAITPLIRLYFRI